MTVYAKYVDRKWNDRLHWMIKKYTACVHWTDSVGNIYWLEKETIHCRHLQLFYSTHEILTFVVRNVISECIKTQFCLQIMDFRQRCWCWPTISFVGVNLQNITSTDGSLCLPFEPVMDENFRIIELISKCRGTIHWLYKMYKWDITRTHDHNKTLYRSQAYYWSWHFTVYIMFTKSIWNCCH